MPSQERHQIWRRRRIHREPAWGCATPHNHTPRWGLVGWWLSDGELRCVNVFCLRRWWHRRWEWGPWLAGWGLRLGLLLELQTQLPPLLGPRFGNWRGITVGRWHWGLVTRKCCLAFGKKARLWQWSLLSCLGMGNHGNKTLLAASGSTQKL